MMYKYVVKGGTPLFGEIEISGAKNAAVAIIPAALMVEGVCRIDNVPQISDVTMFLDILQEMGADIRTVNRHTMDIDCSGIKTSEATFDMMRKLRASYYLIGAMLGRFGRAVVAMPGGCNFGGVRPIDQHIKGCLLYTSRESSLSSMSRMAVRCAASMCSPQQAVHMTSVILFGAKTAALLLRNPSRTASTLSFIVWRTTGLLWITRTVGGQTENMCGFRTLGANLKKRKHREFQFVVPSICEIQRKSVREIRL